VGLLVVMWLTSWKPAASHTSETADPVAQAAQNHPALSLINEPRTPGAAQLSQPHSEHCTEWDYYEGQFGVKNTCDETIVIEFMVVVQFGAEADRRAVERQLTPGETLLTTLTRSQMARRRWMATACPIGHSSSVPFLPENFEAIRNGAYTCVSQDLK
jgi:hypothetical protein